MLLSRPHLAVLLNALYDTDTTRVSVQHPSDTVGELCEFELGPPDESTVRINADREAYAERRRTVAQEHGSPAVDELPGPQSYVNAFLAGGLLDVANRDEVDEFLERNGSPDLTAGHPPVLAGFDTNLLPWRIADVLDLTPAQDGVINGFALATGVLDELDWNYKRSDTQPLEDAFGAEFERLWNQPAGDNREGRLGENYYRVLRDHRYAEEVVSETGDDAIVAAYDEFQNDRKDVLLFSNDRDFVERARAHRVLAQRVTFPQSLPTTLTGSWRAIQDTLYVLAILFGVIKLPKVTVYGVWRGKGGMDWQHERLEIDCRSPKLEPILERDAAILEACEQYLEELASYAHLRWTIEQFHKDAKQVLGLDQFEGRSWKGWHHHVTIVLLTYAFIAAERAAQGSADRPPPFPAVARTLVYEIATQIAESEGLERRKAQEVAEAMVEGLIDW